MWQEPEKYDLVYNMEGAHVQGCDTRLQEVLGTAQTKWQAIVTKLEPLETRLQTFIALPPPAPPPPPPPAEPAMPSGASGGSGAEPNVFSFGCGPNVTVTTFSGGSPSDAGEEQTLELEQVQAAVDATLTDGEADEFTLEQIMEDFGSYDEGLVKNALDDLVKNGPPRAASGGLAIIFDAARDVYIKKPPSDSGGGDAGPSVPTPPSEADIVAQVKALMELNATKVLQNEYSKYQITDDLNKHFSCNVRELGFKELIKSTLTEIMNK